MTQPIGYTHRHERTLRGTLARWWLRRRVRRVAEALERHGTR